MRRRVWRCQGSEGLSDSQLYDQTVFYEQFARDLHHSRSRIIIESPFLARRRLMVMSPLLQKAYHRGVRLVIDTRDPIEHEEILAAQAMEGVSQLQGMGAVVLFTGGLHRKLAIIDDNILWEGSLNILSQNDSCEVMRRSQSEILVKQMLDFIELD